MTRILLVDDHAIVREGFKRLVGREPGLVVVGEAASRLDALPLLTSTMPDLLITDLSLADGTGMALIDDVARHHPGIRTLVLSMHTGGGRGYVSKGAGADELVLAIRTVMGGEQYLSRDVRPTRRTVDPVGSLTPRERQTLQLLVRGLVPKAAAAELGISEKTLYAHRSNLLEKLGARNDRDLARIALERGLL